MEEGRGSRPYTAVGPDSALLRRDLAPDGDPKDPGGGVRGAGAVPRPGRVHDLPLARVAEDRMWMRTLPQF